MGHIYKIAEKSPQHLEDDITMSAVITLWDPKETYRLLMSTSAFLHTRFANRRPTPLIEVRANMIFCLPSTFVLSTRRICWKSSFAMSDCNRPRNKKKKPSILVISIGTSCTCRRCKNPFFVKPLGIDTQGKGGKKDRERGKKKQ